MSLSTVPLDAVAMGSAAPPLDYLVVYAKAGADVAARKAIAELGGVVVNEDAEIGMAQVAAHDPAFLDRVARNPAFVGAVTSRAIGRLPDVAPPAGPFAAAGATRPESPDHAGREEPFAHLQWGMKAINATRDGSYRIEQGDRRTLVAVLDSGVDASHPDLARNVDRAHSANLLPPDAPGANEPADTDPLGHGTLTAGLIAAELNGLGTAGVAPRVSMVSYRVADSNGFVFLGPVVDGLKRAAKVGASVANMAFVMDPWLFNCPNNPADSPAQQAEQRATATVLGRAVDYARRRGVLPVATLGSSAMDLDHPRVDDDSPSFPAGQAHHRVLDPSCQVLPAQLDGVVGASRLGPDLRLASSSNYGLSATDLAIPGGEIGPPSERVLSTFSKEAVVANGMIDDKGNPLTPLLLRDCRALTCGYYFYTALGSPTAAGVAALIVSHYGKPDYSRGGHLALAPTRTERILRTTATPTPCPPGSPTCVGEPGNNSHYGSGLANALAAVSR